MYLAEGNFYAEVGSFVHEILAMIFKGELKVDDALQYFIDNYDDNVFYKVKEALWKGHTTPFVIISQKLISIG